MAQIDTTAVINAIRLAQQGSNPASPAASYWVLFIKSDGLYLKDSSGNVLGPIRGMAADTIWDAAGDIVQGTGSNTGARLAIGTAGQTLRVNSGATALEYVSGGRVLIGQTTPTAQSTSFASIPATFTTLEIDFVCRSDKASVNYEEGYVYLNNDTTASNYRSALMFVYGAGTVGGQGGDNANCLNFNAATSAANSCTRGRIIIPFYAGTTFNKQVLTDFAERREASSTHEIRFSGSIEWENAAAVNRVDVYCASGNFVAGSTFRLYGVY